MTKAPSSSTRKKAGNTKTGIKKPALPGLKARTSEEWLALAPCLNTLVTQYKVPAYIQSDPIQIPYQYSHDAKACELVAFITALFSYGRRNLIIENITNLFRITGQDPVAFMENFDIKRDAKLFKHFVYRFNKGPDVAFLWHRLQWAYKEYGSLENLFLQAIAQSGCAASESKPKVGIAGFTDLLLGEQAPQSYGLKFLFAHPDKGGACKRFNMFLRWMVRQDTEQNGKVDFGLWQKALTPAELLVPLDTHVMNMNRQLRLSNRSDGSWQTAEEITAIFRLLCPEDPIKYDYALFGFSLDKRPADEILSVWQ
jgi:uncharacterized protein (TIGR02757 family)